MILVASDVLPPVFIAIKVLRLLPGRVRGYNRSGGRGFMDSGCKVRTSSGIGQPSGLHRKHMGRAEIFQQLRRRGWSRSASSIAETYLNQEPT